jgi:pimeloyl-ACP methyl ester carboxylesterase
MNRRFLVVFGTAFGLSLALYSGAVPIASAAPPSITSVPVQVIQTSDGTVSYRSDGSGRPLVLIMGFSGSQDAWSPDFVNALAKRHRVITFDNAGIGQTAMLPGTLTISAMADQTAALIAALHLRHPDVLGWSEGGMIAQALVVRHPGDVRRLVLCATFSGNGKATPTSDSNASALLNAAVTSNNTAMMTLIFPPDRLATQSQAYETSVTKYLGFYLAPSTVDQAQWTAILGWAGGREQAGHGRIAVPTLIGDGADDVLTLPVNARKMARAITGAKVVIYPDAGHGFLFQDATAWAARVNTFLG